MVLRDLFEEGFETRKGIIGKLVDNQGLVTPSEQP